MLLPLRFVGAGGGGGGSDEFMVGVGAGAGAGPGVVSGPDAAAAGEVVLLSALLPSGKATRTIIRTKVVRLSSLHEPIHCDDRCLSTLLGQEIVVSVCVQVEDGVKVCSAKVVPCDERVDGD